MNLEKIERHKSRLEFTCSKLFKSFPTFSFQRFQRFLSKMSSSVFTSSPQQVAALLSEIANKVGITEHEGLVAIKAYLDSLTAAPSTPIKTTETTVPGAPKKRKPAAAVPAVGGAGAVISIDPTEDDPLRNHKHRLQTINPALCMGRKVDLKNQITGTRKDDEGSNGIFWPEKQCAKAPEDGEKLCRFCKEKDDEVKSGKAADKHWFGRLDEPIYHKACVVGCGDFFAKYPNGIAGDASTAPPATYVVKAPGGVVAAKKRGPKPKADAAAPAPAAPAPVPAPAPAPAAPAPAAPASAPSAAAPAPAPAAAPAPVEPASAAPSKKVAAKPKKATVAKTAAAPVVAEWAILMYEGRVVARNTKNNYVYEVDADVVDETTDLAKIVKKDDYIGVWKNGAIDAYDLSGAAASGDDNDE